MSPLRHENKCVFVCVYMCVTDWWKREQPSAVERLCPLPRTVTFIKVMYSHLTKRYTCCCKTHTGDTHVLSIFFIHDLIHVRSSWVHASLVFIIYSFWSKPLLSFPSHIILSLDSSNMHQQQWQQQKHALLINQEPQIVTSALRAN